MWYSATNNDNFYKGITWRSPFEEKTTYKICLHSMITKMHGEKKVMKHQNDKNSCVWAISLWENQCLLHSTFLCFPNFYWCPSSGLTSKRALSPNHLSHHQTPANHGRTGKWALCWVFSRRFSGEIFTGKPSPVFNPLVTSAHKTLNPTFLKMYSNSKWWNWAKLYVFFPCFQDFIPFYFMQVTEAPSVSNFCLRSRLGQLSTVYLHPSVISTGI